jgi:hypothetical protein
MRNTTIFFAAGLLSGLLWTTFLPSAEAQDPTQQDAKLDIVPDEIPPPVLACPPCPPCPKATPDAQQIRQALEAIEAVEQAEQKAEKR